MRHDQINVSTLNLGGLFDGVWEKTYFYSTLATDTMKCNKVTVQDTVQRLLSILLGTWFKPDTIPICGQLSEFSNSLDGRNSASAGEGQLVTVGGVDREGGEEIPPLQLKATSYNSFTFTKATDWFSEVDCKRIVDVLREDSGKNPPTVMSTNNESDEEDEI